MPFNPGMPFAPDMPDVRSLLVYLVILPLFSAKENHCATFAASALQNRQFIVQKRPQGASGVLRRRGHHCSIPHIATITVNLPDAGTYLLADFGFTEVLPKTGVDAQSLMALAIVLLALGGMLVAPRGRLTD